MSLHDRHLKTYHLVLKSHNEWPDYDAEVEAFDEDDAVAQFQTNLVDVDKEIIKQNMEII